MFGEKIRRTIAFAGLALLAALPAAAAPYRVIRENTQNISVLIGDLAHTKTVVQDGSKAINRFTMHRLRRTGLPSRGAILLMPALGNNFNGYLTSEDGDPGKSFAAYFARIGYDVWGYSPRETGIATGQCSGALDCSEALNWSLQTVVDDAAYIRGQIRAVYGPRDPVIGGLSMGAASALAVVNARPNDYAGVLAWDGSVRTANPVFQANAQTFCAQFNGLVAAGSAVDDQSLPFLKLVAQLAQTAPNDPFVIPVPSIPPGLTNKQVLVLLLATPNPIAPSPRPGFFSAAGDVLSGQFFFSDTARLTANIASFNDVTANRTTRDLYCSLSGAEAAYNSNLANFTKPMLIIKAGQGFGQIMDELQGFTGGPSILQQMNNFGHIDHFGTPNHHGLLEIPISVWLSGVL